MASKYKLTKLGISEGIMMENIEEIYKIHPDHSWFKWLLRKELIELIPDGVEMPDFGLLDVDEDYVRDNVKEDWGGSYRVANKDELSAKEALALKELVEASLKAAAEAHEKHKSAVADGCVLSNVNQSAYDVYENYLAAKGVGE